MHGKSSVMIRISKLALSRWSGKYIIASGRYYDPDASTFKAVDTRFQIGATGNSIAVSLVTVNDAVTSDYIVDAFYR